MNQENTLNDAGVSVSAESLLSDLFIASAELRFHICSLKLLRVENNPSWHRHTAVMRKVEMALKSEKHT